MKDARQSTTEKFEVDSALLSEIGEKLVTTPHVALSELVKNAYDADATEVHVTIGVDDSGFPTVEVRDDGHGMTRAAVHEYWMRIGTTNKEEEQFSPRFGRRRTGAKGIGRFACRRLGRVLELETTAFLPKDERTNGYKYQFTTLNFKWDDFTPVAPYLQFPCMAAPNCKQVDNPAFVFRFQEHRPMNGRIADMLT